MEFTPNSCSSKCPRTPIYSVGVIMSIRQNLPRSRPDGGPRTSERTTVRQDIFGIFAEKSFLYKNIFQTGWLDRPDGRTSAASNFHIRLHTSGPWGRSVRTAKLQHAIFIYDVRASRPRGANVLTVEVESSVPIYDAPSSEPQRSGVRTVKFKLRFLPFWSHASGRNTTSSGRLIDLPFLGTLKELVTD
jgi:hypothetical protein